MAHDIHTTEAGQNTYAGRKSAWHTLGTVLPEAETMTQLRIAAGILWEYALTPVLFEREALNGTYVHMYTGKSVITRDGATPLGVVSDDYEFMQPAEISESLDEIIRLGGFKPETCLALGNGETTCYCIALGHWSIDNDSVEDYLLYTDTVDGKHAAQAAITPVRTVCRNTLRLGLRQAQVKLALTHTPGHRLAYGSMVDAIIKNQNKVREALVNLSKITLKQQEVESMFKAVFATPEDLGTSAKDVALVRRIADLRDTAHANLRGMIVDQGLPLSGWTAVNAVSETVEHSGLFGGPVGTQRSMLLGSGVPAQTIARAYDYVMAGR